MPPPPIPPGSSPVPTRTTSSCGTRVTATTSSKSGSAPRCAPPCWADAALALENFTCGGAGETRVSVAADPHRYVRGFQDLVDGAGQVIPDRVQVDGVLEPGRERGHGLVCVVAGPVEPPVHRLLHSPPQRSEQRRCGQRGGGHRDRGMPGWRRAISSPTAAKVKTTTTPAGMPIDSWPMRAVSTTATTASASTAPPSTHASVGDIARNWRAAPPGTVSACPVLAGPDPRSQRYARTVPGTLPPT